METSFKEIDEIFDFKGLWDVPSKCGIKIVLRNDKYVVIVSELYKDNPGTSITQASCSLAKQICDHYEIPMNEMIYIEHNPDMNSKLSFYDEEFYLVSFDIENKNYTNPKWKKIAGNEVRKYFK